jgi:putative NADH-flavin reductase
MKLVIFGATGRVGRVLVEQALDEGHAVTAFGRSAESLSDLDKRIGISVGDVFDVDAVRNAVSGHDAVIIALGNGRKGVVREIGTRNIIDAMKETGVSRLICQSTLGAGDSENTLSFFWKYIMFGFFLRAAFEDHQKQEELVRKSGLDWTIVRPAAFTNGERTGNYKHGTLEPKDNITLKISLADVADFLLKQLGSTRYLKKAAGVSY